jgi:pimeloyl-ACP methyl ester carboxylesterase
MLLIAALGPLAGCSDSGDSKSVTATDGQVTAAAEATGDDVAFGSISQDDLSDCGKVPHRRGFRCGTIRVPWERADPELGTTRLNFAVRRHYGKGPAKGTIFAVEGGPGYPSSGTASSYVALFAHLLRDHDLVLLDQRGTGKSGPVKCPDVERGNMEEFVSLGECARRLGPIAQSYRTSASADDVDSLRRALGLEKITLYGDSYGTFLAQSYAYRHPDTLEAVVLDSAYPAYGEDPWYPTLPQDGVRNLKTACDRSPDCHGDAGKRLDRFVELLRRKRRGTNVLIDSLIDAAYGPPQTYLDIDHAIAAKLHGNPRPYRRFELPGQAGFNHVRRYSHTAELAIGCNDYPMIWDKNASEPERRKQLEMAIRDYPKHAFDPFKPREIAAAPGAAYLECLTWPKPNENYEPAVDPKTEQPTKAPVLVVSGEFDDVTTPQEGKTVAGFFPNGRQFVYPNRGHVDALYNAKRPAGRKIRDFLRKVYAGG